jgi:hypothetical protein
MREESPAGKRGGELNGQKRYNPVYIKGLCICAGKPMTITIELPPEVEAGFAALAAKQGVALPDYLLHLLEEQMLPRKTASLSPDERARLWRESAKGMPYTPPLSDAAVSRESFYDARG